MLVTENMNCAEARPPMAQKSTKAKRLHIQTESFFAQFQSGTEVKTFPITADVTDEGTPSGAPVIGHGGAMMQGN